MRNRETVCPVVQRPGTVVASTATYVDIKIQQPGACASCHIKSLCSGSEVSEKFIRTSQDATLQPGMNVTLSMEERLGWIGVVFAFVCPLFVLVGALFASSALGATEGIAGLIALFALVPYFLILYSTRDYFSQVVRFTVQKEGTS